MDKLLTIVIPVYKVEKYIRQCLESVVVSDEQMEKLEVWVINDGTPDGSALIAREFAGRYPESIKIIDKENGGHGSALNAGLAAASGKYIRFLDSDDWITNLSTLITKLELFDVDLAFTHLVRHFEDSGEERIDKIKNVDFDIVYGIDDFSYINTGNPYNMYNFHRCTYRTSILKAEQPLFVEGISFDDSILFLAPLLLAETVCFFDVDLYHYRIRGGQSMDRNVERYHALDYIPVEKQMAVFVNEHTNLSDNQKKQRDKIVQTFMDRRFLLFTTLPYKTFKQVISAWRHIIQDLPNYKMSSTMRLCKYAPSPVSWAILRLKEKRSYK